MKLEIIGVTEIPRIYSVAMRKVFILSAVVYVALSQKAKLALAEQRAREHAHWLVGDEHPTQRAN